MSRPAVIVRNVLVGLAVLIVSLVIVALVTIRTQWFRDYARGKIVAALEDSTGGRVDVGSFDLDATHLRATVGDLVIHGTEPAGVAPFLSVGSVTVAIRLFPRLDQLVNISSLIIDRPQANVVMLADGRSNIPTPKHPSTSKESPLKTVVDLAVGHFELNNGMVALESRKMPLQLHAENLRALLSFNALAQTYQGEIALAPMYVVAGRSTPVTFNVRLPLVIGSDRLELHKASVSTQASMLSINGSVSNLAAPHIAAQIAGMVAIADLKNAGSLPLTVNAQGVPSQVRLDLDVTASPGSISVKALHATLGGSSLEASGTTSDNSLAFRSSLNLGELGRLFKVDASPEGTLLAQGKAGVAANNSYSIDGDLQAKNLAIQQGQNKIRDLNISAAISARPDDLELRNLVVTAFGGRFAGNASLTDSERYRVEGQLSRFDIGTALNALNAHLPYNGTVTGTVAAAGDTKTPKSLTAQARLSISPGKTGIPVSGRVNADYTGRSGDLSVRNSYISLPHSRLDVDGSASKRLNVVLKTEDLNDFLAAAGVSPQTVALNHGAVSFAGTVTGGLSTPRIAGHLAASHIVVSARQFDSLAADLAASSSEAAVTNGVLARSAGLQAQFSGTAGLTGWKLLPREPIQADLGIHDGDLADLAVLAGQRSADYSGSVAVSAHVAGTAGNPLGALALDAAKGGIEGQAFDTLHVQANLTDQLVTIPAAYIQSGAGRADLTGEFQHPRDSFTTGSLHAKLTSSSVDLATVARSGRNMSGTVGVNLDVTAELKASGLMPTSLNGNVSARAVKLEGISYGDLSANVSTTGMAANYTVSSNFAGSTIHVNGDTQLVQDYPTSAEATIGNLPVDRALAAMNHADIPARGSLSGTLHLTGTYKDPHGDASLNLTRAVVYDEPIDQVRIRAAYLARSIDVSQFQIVEGDSQLDLTAHYDHPVGNLEAGSASFDVRGSHIDLARIRNVQQRRAGLSGAVEIMARGEGTLSDGSVKGSPRVTFRELNATVAATGIQAQGEKFGDLKLTANSSAGNKIAFTLDSTLADASIHGSGTAAQTDGYPVDARLNFSNLLYSRVAKLIGSPNTSAARVEATAAGQITVSGPVLNSDQLHASLEVTKLNIVTKAPGAAAKPITISNQGPLTVTLDHGAAQIQNAHLTGGGADIQAGGSASVTGGPLALTLNAKLGLGILPEFDKDIYAAGDVSLNATIRGTMAQPLGNGQLTLQKATFSYAGLPNGISNANGAIVFNGQSASIQNLTAESGGGKITLTGYGTYGDVARFGIHLKATRVRARVQPGVSVVANADIQLAGTSRNSVVSGSTLIEQVSYNPQTTDIGSLLSRAQPEAESDSTPSVLLENMRLDIRVKTSTGLAVQADIAQGISATTDIRVQGTAARPAVLGRITINEGKLIFFGSPYTLDTGTIAFYNPLRIDPILDISLETQTQGIDVIVRVTGPVNNMKLSYTSNPPLQFQEIVGLLAAGRTPTSDPTLLANQPQVPQSSFEQMGESAALGQAVANPVAGSLQRVFGVSQLKIDPAFQGGSEVPTARLTLQQRITSNVTFTYTSALDDPNGEIVKVEWAFDPRWSAVATRDQNGIFSVNFLYKRQFR